jgi:hypothetical protein
LRTTNYYNIHDDAVLSKMCMDHRKHISGLQVENFTFCKIHLILAAISLRRLSKQNSVMKEGRKESAVACFVEEAVLW